MRERPPPRPPLEPSANEELQIEREKFDEEALEEADYLLGPKYVCVQSTVHVTPDGHRICRARLRSDDGEKAIFICDRHPDGTFFQYIELGV